MQLGELKKAFDLGSLVSVKLTPYLGRWVLTVVNINGDQIAMSKKTGGVREFTTLQAGINSAAAIGFDTVTVKGLKKGA